MLVGAAAQIRFGNGSHSVKPAGTINLVGFRNSLCKEQRVGATTYVRLIEVIPNSVDRLMYAFASSVLVQGFS